MRYLGSIILLVAYAAATPLSSWDLPPTRVLSVRDNDILKGSDTLLVPRARQSSNGRSCKCRRCPKNQIHKKGNCRRCVPCPANTQPDPQQNTCVPQKRSKEEKEKQYNEKKEEKKKEFKEKKMDKYEEKKAKKKEQYKAGSENKRNEMRRGRMGFCFTLLAGVGAWDMAEIEKMTSDQIDGLVNEWPEDPNLPDPASNIEDYMVNVAQGAKAAITGDIEMDVAGPPVVMAIRGLVKLFKGLFSAAKNVGPKAIKVIKAGNRPASAAAKDAAKQSSTVGKIMKDQRFLECVATTAGVAASAAAAEVAAKNVKDIAINDLHISIDWTRTDDHSINPVPDEFTDRTLTLVLGVNTDASDSAVLVTYPNEYRGYTNRINYETCMATKSWSNGKEDYDNSVTDIEVWGGCCIFYDGQLCEAETAMFALQDREDGQLDGAHNDAISSVWCTFQDQCKGGPGEDRV